ncbi:hypothetical protein ACFUIW_27715 [Streptomyces sp. NPDC057245]|uniref:hypothetical protein n=1 Tax=Streptomyces TaxID=1883 RepID=UPI0035AC0AF4
MRRWCTARRRTGAGRARPPAPGRPAAGTAVRGAAGTAVRAAATTPVRLAATVPVRLAVVTVLLATTAALPGKAALAAGEAGEVRAAGVAGVAGAGGMSAGYAFADGAPRVEGADDTSAAAPLEPGSTYRSSLPAEGTLYYRLDLDAASDAYVSVTAVPGSGGEVTAVDGVRVSVRDADGASCSLGSATFGAAHSPRPVTAWGMREIDPGASRCQDSGTYYVAVERIRPEDSPPDAWDLELTTATEPRPRRAGPTEAPGAWDSASPEPLAGAPERRAGGSGFARATAVGQGVWQSDIRPGQTLYYKVPVDWGRQVSATAELGGSDDASGYATAALRLGLHNPVRGEVDDAAKGYTGRPAAVGLAALPPVAYANRYAAGRQVGALRFAGDYYLVVHLSAQVADDFGDGPFRLTLRVRLRGAAKTGPGYAGEPRPRGVFELSAADRAVAPPGGTTRDGAAEGGDPAMRAVAVGGIGTGSLLLAGLAVWTVTARRRA